MTGLLRICLIVSLCLIQNIWTIHVIVPEHTNDLRVMEDTLQMKLHSYMKADNTIETTSSTQNLNALGLRQQSVKYPINSKGDTTTTSDDSVIDTTSQINALAAKTSQLRHHTSYDKNDDVVIVSMHNNEDENENIFENLQEQEAAAEAEVEVAHQPNAAVAQEQEQEENNINESQVHSRKRRELDDWLIAPNTRWCGRGNTANGTYNHLGGASMADKCCRKHDHCKVYISAMSNKYGLFNYRPYTLSHCSCDRRFRTCLKMANDEDAKTIGHLFFNMVQTQCFVLSKERVCQERAADGSCKREHVKQKAHLRNNKKF